jgi:hypothetical protein
MSVACRADTKVLTGNITRLAAVVTQQPTTTTFTRFNFRLVQGPIDREVTIETFYSSALQVDYRVNRCAADAAINVITCDLRFIEQIAHEFHIYVRAKTADERLKKKVSLTKWVLAHEIGHIIRGHRPSDYADPLDGYVLYAPSQQKLELEADESALALIGNLTTGTVEDYSVLLDIINDLVRKKLCPDSYPNPCSRLAPGVGLIFNSADDKPIHISVGGAHPEFVARFLRLLYLAGVGTGANTINNLAGQVLSRLEVEVPGEGWLHLDAALEHWQSKKQLDDGALH